MMSLKANQHNNMDPRRVSAASVNNSSIPEVWKTWDGLTVKLRGLPRSTTTLDLWRAFQAEGNVEAIEIFEDKQGRLDGTAKVRFRYVRSAFPLSYLIAVY
jgi:hypothetical protein